MLRVKRLSAETRGTVRFILSITVSFIFCLSLSLSPSLFLSLPPPFSCPSPASLSGPAYLNDCHMLPQAAYVYGWNPDSGEVDRGLRSCHRQLRFESMHADFSRLMEERGYPYRLATSKFQKSNDACGRLGKADLWPSTQELVQELYRMDFELLNYSL
ncbi:unnamed protein product [Prorocentrum cordatum]|uniref:Uncharacterized protein n=1 Tax=Prorocentrum cordatum TaxID=2364126 RepID=A0ABN9RCI6_9DINO|nr:unnamed protein product [Polarella glacialis]